VKDIFAYEELEPKLWADALGLDWHQLGLESLDRLGDLDELFRQLLELLWFPPPPQLRVMTPRVGYGPNTPA
jgi:hypothetical protein